MAKAKLVAKKIGNKITVAIGRKIHTIGYESPEQYAKIKDLVSKYNDQVTESSLERLVKAMTPKTSAKKDVVKEKISKVKDKADTAAKRTEAKKDVVKDLSDRIEAGEVSEGEMKRMREILNKELKVETEAPVAVKTTSTPRRGEY